MNMYPMIVSYMLLAIVCVSNVSLVKSDLIKGVLLGAMIARQKGSDKVIFIPMYRNPHSDYENTTTPGESTTYPASTSTSTSTTTTTESPTTGTDAYEHMSDDDEHDNDHHIVVMPVMPMIKPYYPTRGSTSTSTSTLPTTNTTTTTVPTTTRVPRKHWAKKYW